MTPENFEEGLYNPPFITGMEGPIGKFKLIGKWVFDSLSGLAEEDQYHLGRMIFL